MKKFFYLVLMLGYCGSLQAQEAMEDELLQARMHFMNSAKVSYIASGDRIYTDPGANKTQVPEDIKAAFFERYQRALQVQWIIKDDRYKINFVQEGNDMFAYLDRRGNWIKSFTKIDQQTLPEAVVQYLTSHYEGYELTKCYMKDTPMGSSITLAVKKNGNYVWLEFDPNGDILANTV
ncbi:MAG: hypothetical protein OER04_12055 [Cyclobacteriaceae bacterium]|nr:hypothetical protein [Cyclobacteriaceae bacterium]